MSGGEPIRKRPGGPSGPGGPTSTGPTGPATTQEIPDKLYFRIGEVARLCEVPAYVLRFWESEFPQLKPNKGGTGQRLYRRRDVEMALRIKNLLYDEGYTIAGARQAFKAELRAGKDNGVEGTGEPGVAAHHLEAIRKELRELHAMLLRPAATPAAVQGKAPASVHSIRPARPVPAPRVLPPPMAFPGPRKPSLFDDLQED